MTKLDLKFYSNDEAKQLLQAERVYSIEQFPKNKDITNLSEEQEHIRKDKKKFIYKDNITCKRCGKLMPIQEFYVKDKINGRRSKTCRDCHMKAMGVVEIGKLRFSKKILDKGFRKCSICKDIKPIIQYPKAEKVFGGHSNTCKDCSYQLSQIFIKSQRKTIGIFHIKQYAKQKYGITKFDENIIAKLKNEIIENRKPKYFIDGKDFVTIADFARYIESVYGLPITMTEKRISEGKTEEQCKLTESEMRSIAYTKGKVKVTDTITGEVLMFNNTTDERLLKMFSASAINRCIKTGEKTRITALTKYKNPCTIARI
jgi:hypothetical protein